MIVDAAGEVFLVLTFDKPSRGRRYDQRRLLRD